VPRAGDGFVSQSRKVSREEKNAAKTAAVLEPQKTRSRTFLALSACAALLLGGAAFFFWHQGAADAEPVAKVVSPEAGAREVTYDASLFADGQARFYQYRGKNGITVRYFVLKSSDGVIRAAFDACDSCWASGKGYEQQGDDIVCRNCRQHFASVKVNEVRGGCNPAPLRREVRGDEVVIRVADILDGGKYFDLPQGG
jgi:uncharacterized membrane protein